MKQNSQDINSKPNWLFLLVLGLAFPLVFYHLFSSGFIAWDDPEYLLNNKDVQHFNFKNLIAKYYVGNYHPLTMLNYALDWKLFGKSAIGYHVENLLWHFLNTLLIFYLAKRLQLKSIQAFLVAVVFAFHPLQLESVAWIAERKNVLYAFFFLNALLFYFKYKDKENKKFLIITYLMFSLSLLSKPSAIVFPLVIVLIDVFIYKESLKNNYLRYIPFFGLSIILGVLTMFAQEEAKFLLNTHNYSLLYKIGIFGYGFFHYFSKFLIPLNLSAFYSYPDDLTTITIIGFVSIIIIGLAVFFLIRKQRKDVLFAFLFFAANIILVLQIVPFGDAIAADRYMYLPIIGLTLLFIYLFEKLSLSKVLPFVLMLVLSIATFSRSLLWKESLPLFLNVLKSNPKSFIANNSLGVEYMDRNDFQKAYQFLNQTVKLFPTYYKGYYNRGLLNGKTQHYDKAVEDFTKSLEYKKYYKSYVGRANAYYLLKDYKKAMADAKEALKLDPNNVKAIVVMANSYDDRNDLQNALNYYNQALGMSQEDPNVYLRRGILFGKMAQFDRCLADLNTCTELNPKYAEAYYWKGVAKFNLKQNPCDDLRKAVDLGFMAAQQSLVNYCK